MVVATAWKLKSTRLRYDTNAIYEATDIAAAVAACVYGYGEEFAEPQAHYVNIKWHT